MRGKKDVVQLVYASKKSGRHADVKKPIIPIIIVKFEYLIV